MPVDLTDGSPSGDGWAHDLDAFPVLADQTLEKSSILLHSSANPRMDLLLLIHKDASASTASSAPKAPPGMSAAQFALVQRMLARQRGAAAGASSSSSGPPEPQRGPQIYLTLWRLGDKSSVAWSVALNFEKLMDPIPSSNEQENEDLLLKDVVWSPVGDRFAVLVSLQRSPVKPSPESSARAATFLRTYSVQDGELLSTQAVRPSPTSKHPEHFSDPLTLSWELIDFARTASKPAACNVEALLRKFSPLPSLPHADQFASSSSTGNLMPHQLRMMQMSGQKPPPAFQYPTTLAVQGRGTLAQIPSLPPKATEIGLLEGGDAAQIEDEKSETLALAPTGMVIVSKHTTSQASFFLDGTIATGALDLPQRAGHEGLQSCVLARDLSTLSHFYLDASSGFGLSTIQLSFARPSSYGPHDLRRRISLFSRISHLLRFYLGYALDTASAIRHIYEKDLVDKVTKEWDKMLKEITQKFGSDMKYELLCVLLTGRAGPPAEQLLLANLTEGVLGRLEQQSQTAYFAIKRLVADSLRPSIERSIMCLSELDGMVRFFAEGSHSPDLQIAIHNLKTTLHAALDLAQEVDVEAITVQEFYRWCRVERERQERIKQDQDEPRLAITYDVYTVAKYIERGFENAVMSRILGEGPNGPDQPESAEASTKPSLNDVLARAEAYLSSTSGTRTRNEIASKSAEDSQAVPLIGTLNKVAESTGKLFQTWLGESLNTSSVIDSSATIEAKARLEKLMSEPSVVDSWATAPADQAPSRRAIVRTSPSSSSSSGHLLAICAISSDPNPPTLQVFRFGSSEASLERAVFVPALGTDETGMLTILDFAFFGESDLFVLAKTDVSCFLMNFSLDDLDFQPCSTSEQDAHDMTPEPIQPRNRSDFEPNFDPTTATLAVNTNKQTAAILGHDGKRVLYLDLSLTTTEHPMEEGIDEIMETET